jgi:hypothetical protein
MVSNWLAAVIRNELSNKAPRSLHHLTFLHVHIPNRDAPPGLVLIDASIATIETSIIGAG